MYSRLNDGKRSLIIQMTAPEPMKTSKFVKTFFSLLFAAGGVVSAKADSPLLELGENSSAYIYVNSGLSWCDNIYAAPDGKDRVGDAIWFVVPGIVADIGRDSAHHINFAFSERFSNYLEHEQLNSQLATSTFSYLYNPGRRLRLTVNGSFTQYAQREYMSGYVVDQNDPDKIVPSNLRDKVRRETYTLDGDINYVLTAKLSGTVGFNYSLLHFRNHRDIYSDTQSFSVPVSLFYNCFENFYIGMSYSWSYSDTEQVKGTSGYTPGRQFYDYYPGQSLSHFIGLSTKGSLTSKLSIRGNVGVGWSSIQNRWWINYDKNVIASPYKVPSHYYCTGNFTVGLDYASDRWRVMLTSGRNFAIGGQAQSYTTTYARIQAATYLTLKWFWTNYIGVNFLDFDRSRYLGGRHDTVYLAGTILSYLPNKYWSFSLGYSYLQDESNRINNFDSHTISLSATFKY
jgi:hypothetical protein